MSGAQRRLRKNIRTLKFPGTQVMHVYDTGWALSGCRLFAEIPERPDVDRDKVLASVRYALTDTIKRASIPNMQDIYNQHRLMMEKMNGIQEKRNS